MNELSGSKRAQFANVNGTQIYYEDIGVGAPIIFSHCLLWNTSMYDAQVERLSGAFRCISYDHRGQGRSADHDCNEITVEMLCDDIKQLIEHLKLPPVHFVGHSLGGFVGIMLASRYPQLVRSLVLLNTSGDEEPERNLLKYRLLNWAGKLVGPRLLADALLPVIFHPNALQDSEKRKQFRQVLMNNRKTVWRAANGVINRPSQKVSLRNIHARTLVVTAVGDSTRTRDESERLAAGIPQSELICLPTGGHMLPMEEPEAITELLEKFLQAKN